mgnify:CR=1 FL=1
MSRQIEDLQYKGLKFIQEDGLFRFGTDAVLLASFCDVKKSDKVVDLGTGTGVIPLLLNARTGCKVVGVELQEKCARLAHENALLNSKQDKIEIICADLRSLPKIDGVTAVVCNPPYERIGSGKISDNESVRIARHEFTCTLEDAVYCASRLLETGGRLYMIHRAERAAELIYAMKSRRIEPKIMRTIQAREQTDPRYVLIAGKKDAKAGLKLMHPLIIYGENGRYTHEMNEIYHREEENG